MRVQIGVVVVFILSFCPEISADWTWRGPEGNGHATATAAPSKWSANESVVWSSKVPGRGHSSPIISAGKVFLTTALEESATQMVLCYDVDSGKQLWQTKCYEGVELPKLHPKNTHASPSIAIGGKRALAVFCNNGQAHAVCLDLDGKIAWQKSVGEWVPKLYRFGFGQSPIFYDGKFIVTSESETESFVRALDAGSGEVDWSIERPPHTSYSTPVVAFVAGRKQLLISGGRNVASYDPDTGEEIWSTDADWIVSCGTMVWHPEQPIVYASGGYPAKQTLAIKADGKGELLWENKIKCYEQSMIVVDDCLYGYAEGGILYCWDAVSGEELWRKRLGGNGESASPVFVNGMLYFSNEEGHTWVVRPNRQEFELLAENQLEEEMFASIAVANENFVMRVADRDGERQEFLYRIGSK